MSSTYHLHTDALDEDFLASVKTLYKNRNLTITIDAEMDETERILANPAMKAKLDAALADVSVGRMFSFTPENFERYSEALQRGEIPEVEDFASVPEVLLERQHSEAVIA